MANESTARYKPYPAYQPPLGEWLGDTPEGWEAKKLKFVCTYNDEVLHEKVNQDWVLEYVDIGGVSAEEGIKTTQLIPFSKAPSRARRLVRDGDILVSTVRTYLKAIAPVANPPSNMVASTGFAVVRPGREFHSNFASYVLCVKGYVDEIVARSVGVSYPAINASDLVDIYVPLPPRPEQTKIAAFLDYETGKIDGLLAKQERLIELLEEKRQAVISHAVTKGLDPNAPLRPSGIDWLGDVPAHWEVKRLKYLIYDLESGVSVNATDIPSKNGEVAVLKTSCVYTRSFRIWENKTVVQEDLRRVKCPTRQGSIIISRMNTPDLVGASAVVKVADVNVFLPDRLWQTRFFDEEMQSAEYLAFFMRTEGFRNQVSLSAEGASSSMQNISKGDYLSIPVVLPSKAEQITIVNLVDQKLSALDNLNSKAQTAITLLKERRTALISAAVTGKIDVRDWQPPRSISDQEPMSAKDAEL